MAVADTESKKRPDLRALFLGFSAVGLSGFGGVLPFARRMLVEERQWMSAEEFNAQLGLCQFLPGPNVINLAVVVGKRYQGLRGAIVAPLGLLAGPLVIALLLALLYDAYGSLPLAQGRDMSIVVVNNGGGGIFDYLPQAQLPEFERGWRTPQVIDFKHAALSFGLADQRCDTAETFSQALAESQQVGGPHLIELLIN